MFNLVLYNPMSLLFNRAEEVSLSMKAMDMIFLPGTRERLRDGARVSMNNMTNQLHYTSGYDPETPGSNRTTCCSMFAKALGKNHKILHVQHADGERNYS